MSIIDDIKRAVVSARSVLVITHIGPDGDALGSLTAMGLALKQLGKEVTLICDDGRLSRFSYLTLSDQIQTVHDLDPSYELIIAVDCGDESRMGRAYASLAEPRPPLINIDHHITNTQFGDLNLVDAQASSTTEVLHGLFNALDVRLDADLALSLLTGLVTDTLGFRTVGVSPVTMRIASELMEAGADLTLVTTYGLSLRPLTTLHMWQLGLRNMRVEGGLAWTAVSQEELASINYTSTSSAGLVNMLADVDEVAIGAVLLEMTDGSVRVGFRCRPPYSVSELALNLGGGGHPLAAGCTLEGPLSKAESLVVDMCKEVIRQQTAAAENGYR